MFLEVVPELISYKILFYKDKYLIKVNVSLSTNPCWQQFATVAKRKD